MPICNIEREKQVHKKIGCENSFWLSIVEDKFDLGSAVQAKAEFTHAFAVMDRIGGWKEGEQDNWVGPMFAVSTWIYTKSCCVQRVKPFCKNLRIFKLRSIMEALIGCVDGALDEHVWVSEQTISLQEAGVLGALP